MGSLLQRALYEYAKNEKGEGRGALDSPSSDLLLAVEKVAVEPLVELPPTLDRERVRDWLPREVAEDPRGRVQPEN